MYCLVKESNHQVDFAALTQPFLPIIIADS